ncbi:MAG: permease prefix domain 1-containing protein [Christensenellales bacterium]
METIRSYVESLFSSIPRSAEADRLKEDMLLNLEEKYNALIAAGKSEAEAIGTVIMGIGSADDLNAALQEEKKERSRVKFSAKGLDVTDGKDYVHVGWDGVRIETRENGSKKTIRIDGEIDLDDDGTSANRFPFEAILWPLCIIAYLIMGFVFRLWHPGWMVFVGATLVTILYNTWMDGVQKGKLLSAVEGCAWVLIIGGFLYAGFAYGLWHPAWLVFPIAGLLEGILHSVLSYYKNRAQSDDY